MELKDQITQFLEESIQNAFSTMSLGDPQCGEAVTSPIQVDGLICSIGFAGQLEGSVSICLSNESACKIVSKMLGMDINEVSNDVTDGICEILNIIVGGVKTKSAQIGYNFEVSVPTAVSGHDLQVAKSEDKTEVDMAFACDDYEFKIVSIFKSVAEKVQSS